jgi:hypothetical protein
MQEVVKYLEETFGDNIRVYPMKETETNTLPMYIGAIYSLWNGFLFDFKICLVKPKGDELPTPAQFKKHQEVIEKVTGCPVIFAFERMESYNRNRLIQQQVNFIIADKQIYMPSLLIQLKDYVKPIQKAVLHLQPAAQCLLLFHLQKQNLDGLGFRAMARILPYSYLTINRAVDNLAEAGLCQIEGTKEKTVLFGNDKRALWDKALPMLTSPVKKGIYINDRLPENMAVQTNINALAHYTHINDENKRYLAIWIENFRQLHKTGKIRMFSEYDGEFFVEQWKYDPMILANNGFIDPLSLYLIFRDNPDERVIHEANELINNFLW